MSKYSQSFKIIAAKEYLGGIPSRQLSLKLNIPARQIRYWGQVYSLNGEHSFLPCFYDVDKKLKILTRMKVERWSIGHTSAFFNLSSPGTLFVWLRNYEALGVDGLYPKKRGKPMKKPSPAKTKPSTDMNESELRDELEYLRAENAVLKKFEALLQEKRLQAKKKRK